MRTRDGLDLVLLAAIWGASFLFMRIAAPAFGPVALAFVRVAGAALMLLPLLAWRGELGTLQKHWRPLLLVGITNSALPFICFGYATLSITAGLASIFNAATPLTSALFAWAWLKEPMTRWRTAGLALGFFGVLGLAGNKAGVRGEGIDLPVLLAIVACLLGTLLYGFSASFTKRRLTGVSAMTLATGSQFAAAIALAPLAVVTWPAAMPGALPWGAAAASALLSSGLAYILYFRLIAHVGPTNAASVTFLIPVFAVVWGAWLLDEAITPAMVIGGAVIVAGTALVLGLLPRPKRA
ncbi:DMT family transporter [Aquabacterium sp.]|uniref:DMT family transporter n=1 Tax=Aquabacterium sp. TaxID=1872578 RepID=UPI002C51C18C|nr:DMT family transporter [Aquabacterium sp.]HSW07353.1 DMT family transporter [Aquabacterium sp.]